MTDSKQASQRWVYSFHELKEVEALPAIAGNWDKVVNLLGGKGRHGGLQRFLSGSRG